MAVSASPQISAKILCSSILFTGIEAWEDESARGDVTDELADFCQLAGASQAFRIGRVVLPAGFEDGLPVCATAVVSNDGEASWPETAAVTLVAGDACDFPFLELGALEVGQAAKIEMDLTVPSTAKGTRSVWAIVDTATQALLGPILCLEVVSESCE